MKSNEIAHKWAHQLADNGKCPASMSFSGPSFYSYGTEIARIITHKGKTAYVLNDDSYSVTTSAHQSHVRCAIPLDAIKLHTGNVNMGSKINAAPSALMDYAKEKAAQTAARFASCRLETTKNRNLAEQAQWISQANTVAAFFGLKARIDTKAIERHAARIAANDRREKREAAKVQARREKEAQDSIVAWIAGEQVSIPYGVVKVYLRATDGNLETSKGSTVPLVEAQKAFRFAQRVRATGWHRNGDTFQVGDYQLDAVNENGIVAGCHRIGWDEIERFATAQGWIAAT